MYICICIYKCTRSSLRSAHNASVPKIEYVYMYICIYMHIYVFVCMYVYMYYIRICICIYMNKLCI